MRRFVPALLLPVLLLAACGDDDDTSSDDLEAYSDALASSFAVEEISEDFAFTDDDAECVADRAAEVIGLERFEEVGDPDDVITATENDLSVFDLSQDELDQISEAFLDCVDDAEQLLRDEFLEGARVEGDQAECVADLVDRELLIRILSTGIGGQDPATQLADIQEDFESCA